MVSIRTLLPLAFVATLFAVASAGSLQPLYVSHDGSTTATSCPGSAPCSLQQALSLSTPSTYLLLEPGVHELSDDLPLYDASRLTVETEGLNREDIVIDCNGHRGFQGDALHLNGLTMRNCVNAYYRTHAVHGDVVIRNAAFEDCTVGSSDSGGALALTAGTDDVTIEDTDFHRCKGDFGGAVFSSGKAVTMTNVRAYECNANDDGGAFAFFNAPSGQVTLTNVTLVTNVADNNGGAVYFNNCPSASIDGASLIIGNVAQVSGGGVAVEGSSSVNLNPSTVTIGHNWVDPDLGEVSANVWDDTTTLNNCDSCGRCDPAGCAALPHSENRVFYVSPTGDGSPVEECIMDDSRYCNGLQATLIAAGHRQVGLLEGVHTLPRDLLYMPWIKINVTSVHGDNNETVVDCDSHSGFRVGRATLNSFTMRNCWSNSGSALWANEEASVNNCIFEDNSVRYSGGSVYLGSGTSNITGCSFVRSEADERGGAVRVNGASSFGVYDSSFVDCSAPLDGGGALRIDSVDDVTLHSVVMTGNSAGYGGAIHHTASSVPIVFTGENRIWGNTAASFGGGLYTQASIGPWDEQQSIITANTAGSAFPNPGHNIYSTPGGGIESCGECDITGTCDDTGTCVGRVCPDLNEGVDDTDLNCDVCAPGTYYTTEDGGSACAEDYRPIVDGLETTVIDLLERMDDLAATVNNLQTAEGLGPHGVCVGDTCYCASGYTLNKAGTDCVEVSTDDTSGASALTGGGAVWAVGGLIGLVAGVVAFFALSKGSSGSRSGDAVATKSVASSSAA